MTSISTSVTIEAPPEEVFRRATDLARWPECISSINAMEILTDGPVGKGTRFRETRTMFGREHTEEMEFVVFEPPRQYALFCENHGCKYLTNFYVRTVEQGTELEMAFSAEPLTLFAKIMGFVMKPMMKKIMNDCARDLVDLKAAIEKGPDGERQSA